MTTPTEVQEHMTGEVCPSCESEVLIVMDVAAELRLQCDCGETMAIAPRDPHLAHAA